MVTNRRNLPLGRCVQTRHGTKCSQSVSCQSAKPIVHILVLEHNWNVHCTIMTMMVTPTTFDETDAIDITEMMNIAPDRAINK